MDCEVHNSTNLINVEPPVANKSPPQDLFFHNSSPRTRPN